MGTLDRFCETALQRLFLPTHLPTMFRFPSNMGQSNFMLFGNLIRESVIS